MKDYQLIRRPLIYIKNYYFIKRILIKALKQVIFFGMKVYIIKNQFC